MADVRQKFEEAKDSLRRAAEEGKVSQEDKDAIIELCRAYDEQDMSVSVPSDGEYKEDTKHKEPSSLRNFACYLKRVSERLGEVDLTNASLDDINRLMTLMQKGSHPDVKEKGLSNNSIRNYQGVTRRFFRYHDFGPDPEDITLITGDSTHVDDRDMLTSDEIDKIRKSADHPRDLAIFDLLLYTGQRNTAIRSLRIKDIDLQEGIYYLNDEAEGLKGADETGKKRPLLGAVGSIREWLRYHPDSDNPNAYLITGKPRYTDVNPEQMVSKNTLNYAMKQLKKKAGIDKPMNPHSIRHNFVTIAKREYSLDDTTIKWLIGHSPDSQVMETTYAHLSDEDHIKAAEIGAGIRDEDDEEESSLSPPICSTCGEPLPSEAKACTGCGTLYTPDAKSAQSMAEDLALEGMREAEDDDESDAVEEFRQFLKDNPEEAVEILQEEL